MGLETGTFISDLVVTNPPGTDDKRQGDDHIRLIKSALKNTFTRAAKPWALPGVQSKTSNYSILASDINYTFECDTTSGAFTLTLPVLTASDAGWYAFVVKKNVGPNPVFLLPSTGTLNGYSKVRRTIPFAMTTILWTGNVWIATRPNGGANIGSTQNFYGSVLPDGHLWADGSAFVAANFVELNSVFGVATVPDLRGRDEIGRDNMGVGAAGRLGAIIDGTTVRAFGGAERHTLLLGELAAHDHGASTGVQSVGHTHTFGGSTSIESEDHTHGYSASNNNNVNAGSIGACNSGASPASTGGASANHTHSFSGTTGGESVYHTHGIAVAGSNAAHNNMPPSMVCNKIVVAE